MEIRGSSLRSRPSESKEPPGRDFGSSFQPNGMLVLRLLQNINSDFIVRISKFESRIFCFRLALGISFALESLFQIHLDPLIWNRI